MRSLPMKRYCPDILTKTNMSDSTSDFQYLGIHFYLLEVQLTVQTS